MGIKRTSLVGLALLIGGSLLAVDAMADTGPYGHEAASSAECTEEFPVFETFEDGSAGCYREAAKEWEPGEFERIMLNDPEYDQNETLRTLGVTYEEAVAMGWIDGDECALGDVSESRMCETERDHPLPVAPTASSTREAVTVAPGLPRAGV